MCEEYLTRAKNRITLAAVAFGAAPPLVLVAIVANGGFFTAPGAPIPMGLAGAAATVAGALLKQALDALKGWVICGGASPECAGKLSNIENMLAGAITSIGILATACFAVAAVAWVPWIAQPGMWIVYAALLVGAATLAALLLMWAPLDTCQEQTARSRGALEAGEKAGDPWFLRLRPLHGPRYAGAVAGKTAVIQEDVVNQQFIRLSRYSAEEWEVGAVAIILGPPDARVEFAWTLDGKALGPGSATADGRQSTLVQKIAATDKEEVVLRVDARDKSGFTRTKEVMVPVPTTYLAGRMWVALLEPEFRSPIMELTPERLRPAIDAFDTAIIDIARGVRAERGRAKR